VSVPSSTYPSLCSSPPFLAISLTHTDGEHSVNMAQNTQQSNRKDRVTHTHTHSLSLSLSHTHTHTHTHTWKHTMGNAFAPLSEQRTGERHGDNRQIISSLRTLF